MIKGQPIDEKKQFTKQKSNTVIKNAEGEKQNYQIQI